MASSISYPAMPDRSALQDRSVTQFAGAQKRKIYLEDAHDMPVNEASPQDIAQQNDYEYKAKKAGLNTSLNGLKVLRNSNLLPHSLPNLPNELLLQIFKLLGPASRRLLGATSKALYEFWKEEHYEKSIRVHCDELPSMGDFLTGGDPHTTLSPYSRIIKGWVSVKQVFPEGYGVGFNHNLLLKDIVEGSVRAEEYARLAQKKSKTRELDYAKDLKMRLNRVLEYEECRETGGWIHFF